MDMKLEELEKLITLLIKNRTMHGEVYVVPSIMEAIKEFLKENDK